MGSKRVRSCWAGAAANDDITKEAERLRLFAIRVISFAVLTLLSAIILIPVLFTYARMTQSEMEQRSTDCAGTVVRMYWSVEKIDSMLQKFAARSPRHVSAKTRSKLQLAIKNQRKARFLKRKLAETTALLSSSEVWEQEGKERQDIDEKRAASSTESAEWMTTTISASMSPDASVEEEGVVGKRDQGHFTSWHHNMAQYTSSSSSFEISEENEHWQHFQQDFGSTSSTSGWPRPAEEKEEYSAEKLTTPIISSTARTPKSASAGSSVESHSDSKGKCCVCGVDPSTGQRFPSPILVVGQPGPPGFAGKDGLPGRDGRPGKNGANGLDAPEEHQASVDDFCFSCPTGKPGEPGPPGSKGPPGRAGQPGEDGEDGKEGPRGRRGEIGPDGEPGAPGAMGKSGKPGTVIDIEGPEGPEGIRGPKGPPGAAGPPGRPGFTERGPIGPRGEPGEDGNYGVVGAPGKRGEPGKQGPPGGCGHCQQPRTAPGY